MSLDTDGIESKTDFHPCMSVHSVDDTTLTQAHDSTVHLFQAQQPYKAQIWHPDLRERLIFTCVIILAMMDAFNTTVLIPILPHITNAFDEPLVSTFWASTAYLVFNVAGQLVSTTICELFSHGPIWIIAVVCATIGTGICSGSMSLVELVIGRLVQGLGGGGTMSLCLIFMTESAPKSLHSRYSCYILLTRMIGYILGPIVGGLFADHARWTWAFYFNLIFCTLGLLLIPFAVDLRNPGGTSFRRLRILDWPSATLAFLGPGSLLAGLSRGGISYRWIDWQTLMPITVGVGSMAALGFYESRCALRSHSNARAFRLPALTTMYIGIFCHGFVILCQLQFFALYLFSTKDFSPSLCGVGLLAIIGMAIPLAAVVGILLARMSQYFKWMVHGGWILTTLASGCSILLATDTLTTGWMFLFLTAGLGHGLLLSSYTVLIHGLSEKESGLLSANPMLIPLFMRAWGMAAAVPVGGVVFLNILGRELEGIGLHSDLVNTARGYLVLMDQIGMPDQQRLAIKNASVLALRAVWEITAGVSVVGGISSLIL